MASPPSHAVKPAISSGGQNFACSTNPGSSVSRNTAGSFSNADMIAAVQREAGFDPGELIVVWVESQGWASKLQHYQVIDAALGVLERGTWKVADAVKEQPWLPNGPIPTEVSWSLRGMKRTRVPQDQDHGHGALA